MKNVYEMGIDVLTILNSKGSYMTAVVKEKNIKFGFEAHTVSVVNDPECLCVHYDGVAQDGDRTTDYKMIFTIPQALELLKNNVLIVRHKDEKPAFTVEYTLRRENQ